MPDAGPQRVYPFGRAAASFYLGGCEDELPAARPLLAYGANGSPQALARKLPGAAVAALAGTLRDWAVVHSAHVSPYGQVPATLVRAPGEHVEVHVLLLADRAALDASEPNYDLVTLRDVELEVERLGRVPEVDAYLSKHGPLVLDGAPVPLGALAQERLRAAVATRRGRTGAALA